MIVAMLVTIAAIPLTAAAATHVIELPKVIVFGEEGQQVDLGTYPTPEDLIGQSCTVTSLGNNNHSVHVGNNLVVASVNSVTLVGVEDARNKTTVAAGLLTLGEQITFTLVLGPDPVYSAELRIELDCQPAETTTTTTQPEETTTTVPEETTTTQPEVSDTTVTTTTQPEETTTTTQPEPQATTTTTGPEVQAETTTTVGETDDTLPFTGVESDHLALMAFLAVAAGSGLVLLTRKSSEALGSDS